MTKTSDITVPDVGFEDQTVAVGQWLVSVGEPISVGDRLVELVSSGVLVPVTSEVHGELSKVLHRSGQQVAVGDTLGHIKID